MEINIQNPNLPSGRAFGLLNPASCISSKENETLWTWKKQQNYTSIYRT